MSMDKVTITLRSEQVREIDGMDFESRSEAVRTLIKRGLEYDDLQNENQRLRNEKQTILSQRRENQELVEYLQKERELQVRTRERRIEREQQPVWERFRDWIFGHKA